MSTFSSNPFGFALASAILIVLSGAVAISTSWYSFEQQIDLQDTSKEQYTIYFSLWGVAQYNNTVTPTGAPYKTLTGTLTWKQAGFEHLHSLYNFSAAMVILAFIFDILISVYLILVQVLPLEYSDNLIASILVVHNAKINKGLVVLQSLFIFTSILATFVFLRHPIVAAQDYFDKTGTTCTEDMCAGFIGNSPVMHYGPAVGWSTSLLLIVFRGICLVFLVMIVRKPPAVKDYVPID